MTIIRAALYARFSTDQQSQSSLADQFRVCDRLATQHGFTLVARFEDAAISGGTCQRPGYQALLEAARRREFDVIVAEDCSRLWRNLAEQAPRLAELADLGISIVTQDFDSRGESAGILGAVLGASSEVYRQEIGRRTRRGLEGLARENKPTGGRAYGYAGQEVDPIQARIVQEIFERFAAGEAMRAIAEDLNARGVPSPGADWKRKDRATDGLWRVSAIHSMLENERYIGRVIWNKSRWVRSATDSKRRKRIENPSTEWIVHEDGCPRIIEQTLWDRVQARRVTGFSSPKARPKYLLSGLLECGVCGRKMIVMGGRGHQYVCGNRHSGAGCENDLGVNRQLAEDLILAPVKAELLDPEFVRNTVTGIIKSAKVRGPQQARLNPQVAQLRRLVTDGVMTEAEAAPIIARLTEAEVAPVVQPQPNVLMVAAEYRKVVAELRGSLEAEDVAAARPMLRDIIGAVVAVPTEKDGQRFLTAHFPAFQAVDAMVAGAGFEPTTFGL